MWKWQGFWEEKGTLLFMSVSVGFRLLQLSQTASQLAITQLLPIGYGGTSQSTMYVPNYLFSTYICTYIHIYIQLQFYYRCRYACKRNFIPVGHCIAMTRSNSDIDSFDSSKLHMYNLSAMEMPLKLKLWSYTCISYI